MYVRAPHRNRGTPIFESSHEQWNAITPILSAAIRAFSCLSFLAVLGSYSAPYGIFLRRNPSCRRYRLHRTVAFAYWRQRRYRSLFSGRFNSSCDQLPRNYAPFSSISSLVLARRIIGWTAQTNVFEVVVRVGESEEARSSENIAPPLQYRGIALCCRGLGEKTGGIVCLRWSD